MPEVDINIVALLAATVVNMVVGYIWYSKAVFGSAWQKLVGLSDKDIREGDQVTPMVAMVVLAFVQAFILLHFVTYAGYFYADYSDVSVGLLTGGWAWIGFVLPAVAGNYLFARRRKKLLAIDSLYTLAVLLINGVILSVM
jgi:hypothetical protein